MIVDLEKFLVISQATTRKFLKFFIEIILRIYQHARQTLKIEKFLKFFHANYIRKENFQHVIIKKISNFFLCIKMKFPKVIMGGNFPN